MVPSFTVERDLQIIKTQLHKAPYFMVERSALTCIYNVLPFTAEHEAENSRPACA